MENIRNQFCICKFNKKDNSIEYRAKRKKTLLKCIKKNKILSILLCLFIILSIIDSIYIFEFYKCFVEL